MGGFLATSYSLSYPDKVKHLILTDPWGFPERPTDSPSVPLWIKTVSYVMQPFNPLTSVRMAGPLGNLTILFSFFLIITHLSTGPWFINTLRPDISKKYLTVLHDPDLIPQYIYQCNSQHPR